uniref:Uncharacterized protein n=1 Tax=Spironucleus salmonicida TaxID=348837 RepID=V6M401_9EUKA|eukprot:EST48049.1 Hypothetical protein SS50377_11815 [Spironucleus salmonicida]
MSFSYLVLELCQGVENPQIARLTGRLCERDVGMCLEAWYGIDNAYYFANNGKVNAFLGQLLQANSDMADLLLVMKGVYRRELTSPAQTRLATTHLGSVKRKYLASVVNNRSSLEQALYRCYYGSDVNMSVYQTCVGLDGFLQSLRGEYQRAAMLFSPYNDTLAEKTEARLEKSIEWMNNFAFDMAIRFKDNVFAQLVNLGVSTEVPTIKADLTEALKMFPNDDIDALTQQQKVNLLRKIQGYAKATNFQIKMNGKARTKTLPEQDTPVRPIFDYDLLQVFEPQPMVEAMTLGYLFLARNKWNILAALVLAAALFASDRILLQWADTESPEVIDDEEDILAALDDLQGGFAGDVGK